jgi:hypothetical protein
MSLIIAFAAAAMLLAALAGLSLLQRGGAVQQAARLHAAVSLLGLGCAFAAVGRDAGAGLAAVLALLLVAAISVLSLLVAARRD